MLVKRLKSGDIDAFETLYKLYSLRLYHFGAKYLQSEVEAEGLVQDVFSKVWEKRSSLKTELSFRSYLFTISFNLIRKSFIKKSQFREYLKTQKGRDEFDLDTMNQIDYQSLVDYLNTLVNKLPERRKEIFVKSRIENLPVKEIALKMGISPKTVENQLASAIKFIKSNWHNDNLSAVLFLGLFILKNL
jgi:RNA polymerase sigma-70 factor (ECF subfamily)